MYIEYYIIENLLINYIIISCTSILIKRHTNEKKKWIGAFLGTIYSVAYLYPTLGVLFTLPFKLIIMTFIILTSFTYKDKKEFIRISLVFYLVNVFICGSTYFIIYFTGIEHMKISFLIVCKMCIRDRLVYRCVRIALNCTDIFTCMVVIGIGAQIGIQAALNIAVATSSMPVTGVALPFISYGGTSLIIFMSAVGIVLNISKHVKMN